MSASVNPGCGADALTPAVEADFQLPREISYTDVEVALIRPRHPHAPVADRESGSFLIHGSL